MKQKLLAIFVLLATILPVAMPFHAAYAVDVISPVCDDKNGINDSAVCKDSNPNSNPLFGPEGVLTLTINILSMVVAVIATIVLIIAGIRFMTAQANSQTINSARNQIIYAVVGIAVAAISQAAVRLLLTRL